MYVLFLNKLFLVVDNAFIGYNFVAPLNTPPAKRFYDGLEKIEIASCYFKKVKEL